MIGTWNLDPKVMCITQRMDLSNIWKLLLINLKKTYHPNEKGHEKIVYRRKTNSSSIFDKMLQYKGLEHKSFQDVGVDDLRM